MRVSKMLGERLKEAPKDCVIESHALMIRGGYMKYVSNGSYSLFMPTRRITRKIENIIREEMDKIDGQEVLFPVVMPASLWEQSGRYTSIGSEMARFNDRSGNPMVLGMTHEEAAVQLARDTAKSYTDFPFMIYQLQTKFRDEPRARGGLIRVREFTMKDAYSFHTSQEDLEEYYKRCYDAYVRIYMRTGAKNVVAVKSDSGMMGGAVSHEFMLLSEIGEDTLAICTDCDYKANVEAAECIVDSRSDEEPAELTSIDTPNVKTIDALCSMLHMKAKKLCKAVVYQENDTDKYVVAFIRGDLEVNETKLRNYLGKNIHPATEITEDSKITAGFIGPVGFEGKATVVFDRSLEHAVNLVCGANKPDTHMTGFTPSRDLAENTVYVDVAKATNGGVCPICGRHSIKLFKGIEVGNIFQLGTKYTKSMGMTYLDAEGQRQYPIMGCYGIGVGRLCASICQESHDQYGPIWPMPIAPWQVEICNLRPDDETVNSTAEGLYESLEKTGVEVLYDDRNIRPGSMFADADLFGIPIRIVVSPKTCERGVVELATRYKSIKKDVPIDNVIDEIKSLIDQLMAVYN